MTRQQTTNSGIRNKRKTVFNAPQKGLTGDASWAGCGKKSERRPQLREEFFQKQKQTPPIKEGLIVPSKLTGGRGGSSRGSGHGEVKEKSEAELGVRN